MSIIFFYYFFKFFGLATVNIKLNKDCKIKKWFFKHSQLGIGYNIVLIGLILVINLFSFQIIFEFYSASAENKFDKIIDLIRVAVAFFSSIIILIKFCIHQDSAVIVLNKILAFQETCITFHHQQHLQKKTMFNGVLKIMIINIFMWFLVFVQSKMFQTKKKMVFQTGIFLCSWIIQCTIIQYSVILKLVAGFFQIINNHLSLYLRNVCRSNEICILNDTILEKQDRFLSIFNMYLHICEITREVSKFYAQAVILSLSHLFMSVLVYGFFVLRPVVVGSSPISIDQYLFCFFSLLQNAILLISLTTSVTHIVSEVTISKNKMFLLSKRGIFLFYRILK